jgi:hypothetical protein
MGARYRRSNTVGRHGTCLWVWHSGATAWSSSVVAAKLPCLWQERAAVSQPLFVLPWLRLVRLFQRLPARHVVAQAIRELIPSSLSPYQHRPRSNQVFGRPVHREYMAAIVAVSFLVPLPCADSFRWTRLGFEFVTAVRHTTHSIMVGITPPYLFSPVNQQDRDPSYDFDPKAVTRASYYSIASSTSTPRPKQEGPLIDFNRHPDSYIIVPSARPNVPPMHPNTKQRINTARWFQFALRLLQLTAALGALICVIIIRGVNDVQGWILRIPVSMLLFSPPCHR